MTQAADPTSRSDAASTSQPESAPATVRPRVASTAFPVRGFMLDVSRDRVPTRATLEFLVDLLSRCGFTQLELYMEHTFAHEGEDAVTADASPLDADDMRWLDQLCRTHGLSLVANRNSLGHMERWLKHPQHAHRAENPEGFDQWGRHWPPSTVSITDDNLAFVQHLLEELVATTTAKAVNIGMDEPWEFGQGASKPLVEREGAGKVYTDWVLQVAEPWLQRGYRVEMWGDILGHHPEQAKRLPAGLALVLWGYDSPDYISRCRERAGDTVGPRPGFGNLVAPFAERGSDLWVAPGTGVWNSVTGRLECSIANIVDAAEVGAEVGAGGYLLTSWGDNGHWEGYVHCLVPIVAAGFAAQHPDRAHELLDRQLLTTLVGSTLFGRRDAPEAELLVGVGMLVALLDTPVDNSTLPWHALFDEVNRTPEPPQGALESVRAEVGRLRDLADAVCREAGGVRPGWVAELLTSLDLLEVGLDRLAGTDAVVPASVLEQVRANWLAVSRPGGLDDSLARMVHAERVAATTPGQVEQGRASATGHWAGMLGR